MPSFNDLLDDDENMPEWERYVQIILDMLLEPRFEFAEDTLTGIANWVEEKKHITPKQKQTVENIYSKARAPRDWE